jgi:hypothetical protein
VQFLAAQAMKSTINVLDANPNYTLTVRKINTDGCPNHACFCTGNPYT